MAAQDGKSGGSGAQERTDTTSRVDTAVFDIDGTLVDSNYHHVLAWYRAFRSHEVVVPAWHLHRAIGMGGDQLVAHVAGDEVEERLGDALRDLHDENYAAVRHEVVPFEPARALLQEVGRRGITVVLGSSGKPEDVDQALDLLDAREIAASWTSSADAGNSKPAPDIVEVAVRSVDGSHAVMVGDSIWDVEAAARLGVPSVCVRNGGFGVDELREAGAAEVWESLEELLDGLDRSLLGRPR
ncbi:HAD superfamily hydrolase (TIGR01549 family) [Motilibacter peucedani]|uniref:HAD superfamily hydrolase (TIGR01549 family) n=1 Tax=Motilibacter peucedani TaxID=598650 RepID=A0A420XQV1_9ACTN|nr:HAD family hydrolase [Motilibacter peucedani]RKS75688.1 HAD superfamily hydrolase (TIGR01549 family) [Motilibacter peucedani]